MDGMGPDAAFIRYELLSVLMVRVSVSTVFLKKITRKQQLHQGWLAEEVHELVQAGS